MEDALRGIGKAGGTMAVNWDFKRTLSVGDLGTGYTVSNDLHRAAKDQSAPVNLDDLWQKLGVEKQKDGSVHSDDVAPLAYLRKAMIGRK